MTQNTQILTASDFIETLALYKNKNEMGKVRRFFKGDDPLTIAFGVKFGDVFKIAEKFKDMPISEIECLLDSEFYEVRMGAVSIMDFQARDKKVSEQHKKVLFELYLDRHDRLNNWDFVDRAAPSVIGGYLLNKPKDILYQLAASQNPWERRTAIVSTYAFIKTGQLDDTFKIAEILLNDHHELVNKAVGSWLRTAGSKDKEKLLLFLKKHAATMPRVTLRYTIEKLSQEDRKHFLGLKE
ncbi:DNA alkylation repair protein [Dyadobacter crusticola]|uniref:DNA alkylation repair protein n=1 Tax=Dyadobacter crusticola TaxID=292407 RepID=UPI0004E27189|nr:DNA alkylation repair protein [Dyadobacter crusticola]